MKSQVLQYEQQISLLDFWEQFIYNKNNGANAKTTGKGNKNYGIKYTRVLNYPNEEVTTQQSAELITEYVKDFNELLNTFLSNQDDERLAITLTEKRFRELFNGKIRYCRRRMYSGW